SMPVGSGAEEHEAAAYNVPLKQRGAMTDEGIAILRKLWAAPDVSHHGKYYQFEHVTITPRPAKKIDIWVGGRSDAALRRVARLAGGWVSSFFTPPEFSEGQTKNAAFSVGYGPGDEEIEAGSILFCHVNTDGQKARRDFAAFFAGNARRPPELMLERSAVGTPEECREVIQRYVEHGLTKYALWPACPPHQLLQQLAY